MRERRRPEFCAKAFGVTELFRVTEPSGRMGHAKLDFAGRQVVMLSGEYH